MLRYLIDLLGEFLSSGISGIVFYPILCLAFLATLPYVVRAFVRR